MSMSAICGWFAIDTSSPVEQIEAMTRALPCPDTAHTIHQAGPDRALATTSASFFHDRALWIACEGAPYFNAPDLRALAERDGIAAAIAEGYRRRGRECLSEIHGAFALALIDSVAQRALLAVDRLGIRPLCLARAGSGLVFASSALSVAAHRDVAGGIDPQSVYDYLYFHMVPSPRTIHLGVEKLLPGQYAVFENGRLDRGFYWHMRYGIGGASQPQLAEEFRGVLRDGVRRALARPHRKLGNFLSGGTDSSTLAGLVTELTGAPAETYSIGFDAPGYDESHYADIAVQHFGTRHHTYYVTPQDVVDAIPLIARQYDEPFGNASAVPTYYCAKMAKEDGVDLMIAGDGGDELFGGNARYVKQKTFELYYNVPAALRRALIEPLAFRIPGADSVAPLRKLRSYITQARVPLPDRLESYNFLHRSPARDIFDAAFLERIDVDEPVRNLREVYRRTDGDDALYRMLHLDLKVTLADSDLRKVNRMCESAGVGVSYPLLDDAMVEFSGRVPADLMIKGYTLRYFFKDSLKDFLPDEIIKKSKHGFGLPFGLWLNQHAPLRELVGDSLQSLRSRGYINPRYIDTLLDDGLREHANYYGVMIWVMTMLEQWLRAHPRDAAPGRRS